MKIRNRFFITGLVYVALAALPFLAAGQHYIEVLGDKDQPLEDAVIVYYPLTNKAASKVLLTDTKGRAQIHHSTDMCITISKLGFVTTSDTLPANESRTYRLKSNNVNLKDVVVTGQFEATTTDKSVQRVKIIDRKRIDQQAAVNLRDVLSNELNIRISQDAVLGTQMSMQGMGGQNIKILIDGVPVIGRMDGNIDISQLNLNNVERIEIVEGPMSVIYGTDALGGVINLVTKKSTKKTFEGSLNSYNESVGTYNLDGRLAYKFNKTQIAVNGGRYFFDGYSQNEDPYLRVMQWKPKTQYFGGLQLVQKYKNQTHRLQTDYFWEKITSRGAPTVTPYSAKGSDAYFYTNRITTGLYSDFLFSNKATFNLINSYSYFKRTQNTYNKNLVTGDENITTNPEDHDTTTFGLILMRGTYTTNTGKLFNSQMGYDINLENGTGKRLENGKQSIQDYAVFYISDIKATSRLTLRQGIRFIYNSRYGAPVIPSFNVKYDLTTDLSLRASYAQGFRAPSLKELSLFFVDVNHNIRGNENLSAETSNNYNASLSFAKKYKEYGFKIEPTLFYNDIKNMITLAVVDPVAQLYNYINIDEYKTLGLTINTDFTYKNVSLVLGGSRTGRYNSLSKTSATPEFTYSNEYRANVSYSIKKLGIDMGLFYKYNGVLPGYAMNADSSIYQTKIAAYSMLDGSISKSFWKGHVQLSGGVKNILGVQNINYNVAASAHSGGSGAMPIGMGRVYFIGIKINVWKS